jgi:ubiquinone/menaquinone biosynthesis C-methylase UbiE
MSPSSDERIAEFYAQTYDESVPDWEGEIEFYQELVAEARHKGKGLLEIACGTGRVAIRLAQKGTRVTGLDLSPKMLAVAREKSKGMVNIRWTEANMCAFELGETFGVAIIPGHSFQNLNTPQEQAACLECIHRHLEAGGKLVVHLDHQSIENVEWLGSLVGGKGGVFEAAEQFQHEKTGRLIRASRAWSYEPATQTAISTTNWEAVDSEGKVIDRWQTEPIRLHVVYRFEMEHLLARTGFLVEAVYGDFFKSPLDDKSVSMIWVARKPKSL